MITYVPVQKKKEKEYRRFEGAIMWQPKFQGALRENKVALS
jgi:hypothetical protein